MSSVSSEAWNKLDIPLKIIIWITCFTLIGFLFWNSESARLFFLNESNIDVEYCEDSLGSKKNLGSDENSSIWTLHDLKHVKTAANGLCNNLKEASYYFPPSKIPTPSPSLLKALRNHEKLQKRCVYGVKNWTLHFNNLQNGFEDCRYIVWLENGAGLGNRFLSLLSAFTYALLTNRTLLIDSRKDMNELLCEPFPETSWLLPSTFPFSDFAKADYHSQFVKNLNNKNGTNETNKAAVMLEYWYLKNKELALFFCDDVQKGLEKAHWLSFQSDQYIIPGLYLIPNFRNQLRILFPHYLVSPYLARYLLHPHNLVWDQITRVYRTYFTDARLRLGVQIRNFNSFDNNVTERVFECINKSGLLPLLISSDEEYRTYLESENKVKSRFGISKKRKKYFMFIASLDAGYYDFFRRLFKKKPTKDQDSVIAVHSESHDSKENHTLDRTQAALVEMWLLSMTDVLFKSDYSTFGYVARALQGSTSTTYSMNICDQPYWSPKDRWKTNKKPVCNLSKCMDTCFHVPPKQLQCANAPYMDSQNFSILESRIGVCEDVVEGIALCPNSRS